MKRHDVGTNKTGDELLIGGPAIAEFLGGVSARTVTRFIKDGLPVVRLGLPLATTKRLVIEWVEARAREGTDG